MICNYFSTIFNHSNILHLKKCHIFHFENIDYLLNNLLAIYNKYLQVTVFLIILGKLNDLLPEHVLDDEHYV